ncbi:MAG: hypothetical protein KIS96_01205 [Bauldia sp.]|nr:hypothetical protein [Bauldia sp.]
MPIAFTIRDTLTGEIHKRHGADADEMVKNGMGRYEFVDRAGEHAAATKTRPKPTNG